MAAKVGGRVVTGQMVVVAKLAGRVGNKGGSQGGQMVVGEIESVGGNLWIRLADLSTFHVKSKSEK